MNFQKTKQRMLKLSTAHFCDASKNVKVLSHKIHQIVNKKIFGYAFTLDSSNNIDFVTKALGASKPNNVLVVSGCKKDRAMAGEIFATIAKNNKLSGIIIDGACRDIEDIRKIGLPFYAKTICPRKVAETKNQGKLQVPIKCGNVIIKPNDIIFGDADGVIVIPEKVFTAVLPLAEAVLKKELLWLKRINMGIRLQDVFQNNR